MRKENGAEQGRRKHNGEPGNGGLFVGDVKSEAGDLGLIPEASSPYASMNVADIDRELAGYHADLFKIRSRIWKDQDFLADARLYAARPQSRRDSWRFKNVEADTAAAQLRIDANQEAARIFTAEHITPIDDEFAARGGWTRFYLVTGRKGGHVHRSLSCSSCGPRTQYVWLTDESGKTEDEIVERAGDGACTYCYPSAPVADKRSPRPNPFEDPEVVAKREALAAEKNEKDQAKAALAVTAPDGTTLLDYEGRPLVTELAAERAGISALAEVGWFDRHKNSEIWIDSAARIQLALAAKRGVDISVIQTSWAKKVKAKARSYLRTDGQRWRMERALESANELALKKLAAERSPHTT